VADAQQQQQRMEITPERKFLHGTILDFHAFIIMVRPARIFWIFYLTARDLTTEIVCLKKKQRTS
jgi:hypothetical protein